LIGGWNIYSRSEIAQQYYDAANILVEAIKRNQWEDFKLAYPVLYLYRHFLELMLKAIIDSQTRNQHDIGELTSEVEALVQARYGQTLPYWIRTWLMEFAERDSRSTAYRYGEYYDKSLKAWVSVAGEEHVELRNLQSAMEVTYSVLNRLLNDIRPPEQR